jgi:hypothetical protein
VHAAPFFDPRHPQLVLGLLVLVLALFAMAVTAPELGSLDLAAGGGSGAGVAEDAPAPGTDLTPSWATDPLRPPLDVLSR